jgi:Neuraminidase (sialidase)
MGRCKELYYELMEEEGNDEHMYYYDTNEDYVDKKINSDQDKPKIKTTTEHFNYKKRLNLTRIK